MKKVLVISYYWPPAGGPGVQRWLKFTTYLQDFGIQPVVYVPENPEYPLLDPSLEEKIPGHITVYKGKIREPLRLTAFFGRKKAKQISKGIIPGKKASLAERLLLWIRGNFFIPDARVWWVSPSVSKVRDILAKEGIDTMITTGPPHSVHLIGDKVKQECNVKWLADFRDPWTSIGYHKDLKLGGRAKQKHKQMEANVLRSADKILVTSQTTKEEFSAITTKPIVVLTNGYDKEEYDRVEPEVNSYFTISHIGSLLSERNPVQLWSALAELLEENKEFREQLRIRLVGVVSPEVVHSIHSYGLQPYLELQGYVSHTRAIALQKGASVLLLLEIDREVSKGIIPGKLFEYMASGRPVIAIGPGQWEAGKLLEEEERGKVFGYQEKTAIKEQLSSYFTQYKNGELVQKGGDPVAYSRYSITAQLAKEL
ncbi:MAG: glycosyltransferase family 4 protein [Flavobacteriaceae bacterium]|nr:glycosyltransferase family 4 protein [Flavobacteriaceae bacterium]